MKHIFILLLSILSWGSMGLYAQDEPTMFTITDGNVSNEVRSTMEKNLFEMFKSCQAALNNPKTKTPILSNKAFTKSAIEDIKSLWECSTFLCPLLAVEEKLIKTPNCWEVRNIPVTMLQYENDADKELVISFDDRGMISGVDLALNTRMYKRIMAEGVNEQDFARRQMITNFVEIFRTAYNKKDLKYLEQVYSDDALIITGRIVTAKAKSAMEQQQMYGERIEYIRHDKQTYLANLKKAFANAHYINIKFSDVSLVRHPKHPDIYGVTIRQDWTTNSYHDDGFVFLMIDFADENNPQIHVRTWQPAFKNGKELTKEEIFGIGSFQIGGSRR